MQKVESVWHKLTELTAASNDPLLPPMVTLQIVGGRKEKIRAGDVLGALTGADGDVAAFTREQVGKINVNEFSTYVAIERSMASAAQQKLSNGGVKGKSVKVRVMDEA